MSKSVLNYDFKLDPWSASSLLQKSIRRGEVELADHAAQTLYRYRGKGVWRRLMTIAFEDVGIADPDLLLEVAFLASDKQARLLIGDDLDLILNLTERLCLAPKDRSTDYLICTVTKIAQGKQALLAFAERPDIDALSMATDNDQSIVRRAAAALSYTGLSGDEMPLSSSKALTVLLGSLERQCDQRILQAVETAARLKQDRFILMAAILGSARQDGMHAHSVMAETLPPAETLHGIPLYTFDKHTWAGKRAISEFARDDRLFRELLAEFVPQLKLSDVALMAAFYADAIPIANRLDWEQSRSLEALGLEADMTGAGCKPSGIEPIIEFVRSNLDRLNDARRHVLLRKSRS